MIERRLITFWGTKGKYGFLSNFSYYPILVNNDKFPTSEHYYQYRKFDPKSNVARNILIVQTPREAKNIGQSSGMREDWDNVKVQIMYDILYIKVGQNLSLKRLLLDTGNALLVEDSPYDYYWGCGASGEGKNILGRLWMKLREELRQ